MTPTTGLEISRALIEGHEGRRGSVYKCSEGKLTVGVGHNLEARPLNDFEIDLIFTFDLAEADKIARSFPYFETLNPPRQAAMIDMAFQLGNRLQGFKKMHAHLAAGAYRAAAVECLDSLYAKQTKRRAMRIASIIEAGVMF